MPPKSVNRPAWPAWYGFAALALAFVASSIVGGILLGLIAAAFGLGSDSKGFTLALTIIFDVTLVVVTLFMAAQKERPRPEQFGVRPTRLRLALKWGLIAIVVYVVAQAIYVSAVHPSNQSTLKDLGAGKGGVTTALIGIAVVGIAPIAEEFFFRGFLYGSLRNRFSFVPAAVIAGLAFGAVHASTGPQAIPPLAVLGLCLCLLYEATGSILPGICIHAVNNMLAFGSDKDGSWGVGIVVASLVLASVVTVTSRPRTTLT